MPYIFGKLWHLAIIWTIRKAFQCILQGVRILLANHTRISPTSDNDSYILSCYCWAIFAGSCLRPQEGVHKKMEIFHDFCYEASNRMALFSIHFYPFFSLVRTPSAFSRISLFNQTMRTLVLDLESSSMCCNLPLVKRLINHICLYLSLVERTVAEF